MPSASKTRLDQNLLSRIAEKMSKQKKYIREQISKRAARLNIVSEAAQILWAKELGIGTAVALRKLEPHIQEQVHATLPSVFANKSTGQRGVGAHKIKRTSTVNPRNLAIEYLLSDCELKDRCGDLLKRPHHFDTVFREATTVLENRIKSLSGLRNMKPQNLIGKALNPDPNKAILVVSDEPAEQQGFHSICRGIVLTFRNRAHHELDDKVTREDALKVCSFIDVLLNILAKSKKNSGH